MSPKISKITSHAIALAFLSVAPGQTFAQTDYPQAKQVDQTDDYHGTIVADPYRWLGDTEAADTRAWIEAENEITFAYLNSIPEREYVRERLTQLWNYEHTERAQRAGATGVLKHLASFFKSPLGSDENDFSRQFDALESWAQSLNK